MDEYYIPYEEALELEKLVFNEYCMGAVYYEFVYRGNTTILLNTPDDVDPHSGVKAPMFCQAFHWFRQKYKLHQFIQSDFSYNISGGIWDVNGYEGCRYDIDSEPFSSYEEAELDCLRKLIEIVKNNL